MISKSHSDKRNGWNHFSMLIQFDSKKEYCVHFFRDRFMKMFLGNIDLRPSCYDCQTICFYRAENEFDFLKFSAEAQISNIISPANLSTDNVYEFVQVFEVNYLYSSNEETVKIFESKYVLNPTEHRNLYKVERIVV